jgi:hypothetical protein
MTKTKQTASKKVKKAKSVTKFRVWCLQKGITQKDIREKTELSIGCLHGAWREGKSTKSTINKISSAFGIDKDLLTKMIKEFVTFD